MEVQDLITEAAILIRAIRPGQALNPEEYAEGFVTANQMLDAWAAIRLTIYAIVRNTYSLVAHQQSYLIGPGAADFPSPRPIRIEAASLLLNNNQYPMELLNERQWLDILQVAASGAYPRKLYNDSAFPVSTLYVWPVPSGTPKLILDTWQQLVNFAALTTTVALPPAFLEAVRYNLALRLAPALSVPVPPDVQVGAASSLDTIGKMVRAVQGLPNVSTVDALGAPAEG